MQMLCEVPEGSDVFLLHKHFYWAEALARSIRCTHILVDLLCRRGAGRGIKEVDA